MSECPLSHNPDSENMILFIGVTQISEPDYYCCSWCGYTVGAR